MAARVEQAMRLGGPGPTPDQFPLVPEHVRLYLEEHVPKASSIYWIGEYFSQALELAKYPPGFVAPHPAYLAYNGPGIAANEHVQNHMFNFACPQCGTIDHVVVLSSEWGVNLRNGDARGQFTATCTDCTHQFTGGFED